MVQGKVLPLHAIIPAQYIFWRKFYQCSQRTFVLIMVKQNSNQKMVGFIKNCDQHPHKFNFLLLFQLSSKTAPEHLNLKFRPKFSGFNNHGCLKQEASRSDVQNVQSQVFKILKCLKILTPHSSITIVDHYYAPVIEGYNADKLHILKLIKLNRSNVTYFLSMRFIFHN